MAIRSFDQYFMNLPGTDAEPDFDKFWDNHCRNKKVSIEPEITENSKKTTARFRAFDVSYNGF